MKTLLENVEFQVTVEGENLTVTAPFWRTDIETREDVVEEVGRLYGFDKLPLELPQRSVKPVAKDRLLETKARLRLALSEAGANEILTYSFVHAGLFDKVGQDAEEAFTLSNALSPDLQHYRLSLTPSLLEKVHPNVKAGYGDFAVFEIGTVHGKSEIDDDGLPKGMGRVALVWAADGKQTADRYEGAPYYQARKFAVDVLTVSLDPQDLSFTPLAEAGFKEHKMFQQMLAPYEPNRSAVIMNGKAPVGVVGEYKRSVARALKLPPLCAGFELFLSAFKEAKASTYVPLPRFPEVTQDITLKVPAALSYEELFDFVRSEISKVQPAQTIPTLGPLDIYQKSDDAATKQMTFRFTIASFEKTMTDSEVNKLLDAVAAAAKTKYGAERV
jgi:phenylalanyl-tRNA synthetase beta chain